jgi:sodium transport system permease protein
MRFSIAYALFRRDLLEALRDRRTLGLVVLLPLLLYPLLMLGTSTLAGSLVKKLEEKEVKLAVWGPAPGELLERVGQAEHLQLVERREEPPADAEAEARRLFKERTAQAVLRVERAPGEGVEDNLALTLYFESSRAESASARRRLDGALERVGLETLRGRLERVGLPVALAEPLRVETEDVREPGAAGFLPMMLPYLLLMALLLSGYYPALDVTAGEKERGTLQTLLCAPVRPLEVVAGKYGAVLVFAMVGTVANLGAMGLSLALMGSASGTAGTLRASAGTLVALFAALVPLALLVTAVLVGVGVMARSFKEGNSYLTPVLFVLLVPAMASQLPGVELTPTLALVPILNVSLLMRELLMGNVSALLFGMVFTSSLAWAVGGILFAARVFESEQVLLSGEKPWRDLLGRRVRRGDELSPGSALLFFAVTLVVSLFAAVLLWKRVPLWANLVLTQVGIFLGLSLLWVKRSGADPRETFSLRLPTRRGALALLLLVPGMLGVQLLLHKVLGVSWVPGLEEFNRLMEAVMKQSATWPLALALVTLALAPAVCEEAAFRGVMLAGLARTGSRTVAVVGSALAFGLLHVHPVHALIAAVMGLLLGHATLRTRSLLAGVVLHFANNATSVLISRMETQPAWLDSWPLMLALCVPGVVALWLLRGTGRYSTSMEVMASPV